MSPEELRRHDSEEAARLQTFLLENYPEERPSYPDGIMEWARRALMAKQRSDVRLLAHVQEAETRIKGRNNYVHMVLGMVKRHLM